MAVPNATHMVETKDGDGIRTEYEKKKRNPQSRIFVMPSNVIMTGKKIMYGRDMPPDPNLG